MVDQHQADLDLASLFCDCADDPHQIHTVCPVAYLKAEVERLRAQHAAALAEVASWDGFPILVSALRRALGVEEGAA